MQVLFSFDLSYFANKHDRCCYISTSQIASADKTSTPYLVRSG